MKLYETERLIIRKWVPADAEDLFEIASDASVTTFLHFQPYENIYEAHDRLEDLFTRSENDGIDSAIELKETGRVIGTIRYSKKSDQAGGIIDVGYLMGKKHQGHGYMTEALRGLFKYIKENKLGMRIYACHDTENLASGRVMRKAGMTFEGIQRKAATNNKNKRADMAFYSILIEEI